MPYSFYKLFTHLWKYICKNLYIGLKAGSVTTNAGTDSVTPVVLQESHKGYIHNCGVYNNISLKLKLIKLNKNHTYQL